MLQAVWIEIPVKDLERAMAFYQAVFQLQPTEVTDDGIRRTNTLHGGTQEGIPGVSLNLTTNFEPSDKGVLVYLDAGENINAVLPRVEAAGGKVTSPKTSMGEAGNLALIQDSEGNTLALYDYINE